MSAFFQKSLTHIFQSSFFLPPRCRGGGGGKGRGRRLRHTTFAKLELVQAVSERAFGVLSIWFDQFSARRPRLPSTTLDAGTGIALTP